MVRGAKIAPVAFLQGSAKKEGLPARTFGATELESPRKQHPSRLFSRAVEVNNQLIKF